MGATAKKGCNWTMEDHGGAIRHDVERRKRRRRRLVWCVLCVRRVVRWNVFVFADLWMGTVRPKRGCFVVVRPQETTPGSCSCVDDPRRCQDRFQGASFLLRVPLGAHVTPSMVHGVLLSSHNPSRRCVCSHHTCTNEKGGIEDRFFFPRSKFETSNTPLS